MSDSQHSTTEASSSQDTRLRQVTARVEPGIQGVSFLRACAQSKKALRRVLGFIVINSYDDLMILKGKKHMAIAFFKDINHVKEAMENRAEIDLNLSEIPEQILDELDMKDMKSIDDTGVISVVLTDVKISFAARIWLDKDIFFRT